jgi:RNA polymerase sigma-70 factor, ECF subfamily
MNPGSAETDLALIAGMKSNHHPSYEELYNKYAGPLYVFAANKLHSREIAEELVHDVFIRLWEKRDQIEIQSNVSGYLFRMMRNEILQYLRSTKNTTFIDEMVAIEVVGTEATDENIYFKEMETQLKSVINNLPDKCREIFVLSREQDLSIREIASHLNVADQTVKNQLTKALTVLRRELKHITHLFFNILLLILLHLKK